MSPITYDLKTRLIELLKQNNAQHKNSKFSKTGRIQQLVNDNRDMIEKIENEFSNTVRNTFS